MSDLISRSKVISVLEQLEEHSLTGKMDISNAIYLLNNQPAAYSVDKVVEKLEELRKKDVCDYLYCDVCAYTDKCSGQTDQSNNLKWDKAIEIVKHGVAGTETKTIRDKAIEWNNHSSKKVPYEFIDYAEGKREIDVNDDVCEWKYNDTEYYWESSCDRLHIFMSDGPKENEYEYCPYCGKKIKVLG